MKQSNYFSLIFLILIINIKLFCQSTVKILFDAKKAETAGNADWVIDADQWNLKWSPNATVSSSNNQANAQRFPTPSQTLITGSTPETFWTGGLSYWGIDCVKQGYQVETLPYNAQITYGNSSNVQDLSNYKVYIVCEPNIQFTISEKTAIMNFIQNGGSLFMISDHTVSDRNFDGIDSPDIWNDFISNNNVANNAVGFKFDLADISQTTSNILLSATDSILHGSAGNVTQVKWSGGTTMSLNPTQNPSVKGVIYTVGTGIGNSNVLCAYSRVGKGKVAAIGDSSPPDDATGDPNDILYNGYIADASGNHQRLLMNITIWLARGGNSTLNTIEHTISPIKVFPNPTSNQVTILLEDILQKSTVEIIDFTGKIVKTTIIDQTNSAIDINELADGIYFLKLFSENQLLFTEKIVKQN